MSAFKECQKCGICREIAIKTVFNSGYSPKRITARKACDGITVKFHQGIQSGKTFISPVF